MVKLRTGLKESEVGLPGKGIALHRSPSLPSINASQHEALLNESKISPTGVLRWADVDEERPFCRILRDHPHYPVKVLPLIR
jgi:hypothetical protein